MFDKLKTYQKIATDFVKKLNDIRFVGQVIFVVLVLLISWSGVKAIQTNYNLQKQISALQQQNSVQQLKNSNLKLQNQYYSSNQYQELSARQNLGLARPGEKEILVPKNVALAYTVNVPSTQSSSSTPVSQPGYQKNVEAWVNFFLHRPGTD